MLTLEAWLERGQNPKKTRYRIPKVSQKRMKVNRVYSVRAKAFKKANPICQVCITTPTTDVHHTHKRGRFLLDESTWLAVCRTCHKWIHEFPAEARAMGYLK